MVKKGLSFSFGFNRTRVRISLKFGYFCPLGIEDVYKEIGECGSDVVCPTGCTCDGTVVDCSGLRLTEIPKDIPIQTTEL